eukprot:6489850-Amphidinium_carterae.1
MRLCSTHHHVHAFVPVPASAKTLIREVSLSSMSRVTASSVIIHLHASPLELHLHVCHCIVWPYSKPLRVSATNDPPLADVSCVCVQATIPFSATATHAVRHPKHWILETISTRASSRLHLKKGLQWRGGRPILLFLLKMMTDKTGVCEQNGGCCPTVARAFPDEPAPWQ